MSYQQERSEAAKINAQPDSMYGSVASYEPDARLQSIIRSYQLSERSIFTQDDSADPVKPLSFEFNWKTFAGVVGNVLEWYDFACFGYFSDIIADQFFPSQAGNAALIESYAIFGGAFLMRPIGGITMGYIGDKYGAQRALEISVFLMAFPTFAMGCLPTYSQVGILSPILLLIVRLMQGFSVGGQLMSSLLFTVEDKPKQHYGFYGSLVMATANVGTLLGGLMGFIMHRSLTTDQLESFGWRIPFLSGVLVSISGFYLRKLECSHHGAATQGTNPIKEALNPKNRMALISSSLVPMLWSSGFYVTFVWMAIYMTDLLDHPIPNAFGVNATSLFFSNVLFFPIAGILADKFGTKRIMRIAGSSMVILGPPLVMMIGHGTALMALAAQTLLGIILALWGAPMMRFLVEAFPPEIRLTSVQMGYNIAQAIVGGSSPGVATYLVDTFGFNAPGYMLSVVGCMALTGLYVSPEFENEYDSITLSSRSDDTDDDSSDEAGEGSTSV